MLQAYFYGHICITTRIPADYSDIDSHRIKPFAATLAYTCKHDEREQYV